jgi:hypothetical protein
MAVGPGNPRAEVTTLRLGLCLLAFLIGGAACGVSPAPTPLVFDEPIGWDPGPDVGGRALQEQVFADGRVTADEYERAMQATVQCIRDEGFDIDGPLRYPDGALVVIPGTDPTLRLTIRARVVDDPNDRYGDVNGRCQAQWSYAIEALYFRQFKATEADVQAWLERAWACGAEKAVRLSSPPTEDEATSAVIAGCRPWEADG